jgi:tetratricopeptide (TPR) repeat protein
MDDFLDGFVQYTASVIAEEQGVVAQQDFPKLEMVSADTANTYEALLHLYYTERSNSLEQFQKAILALRHALKDSPDDGRLWNGLARVYISIYALELLPELVIPIEEIVDFAHKGVYLGSTDEDAWCVVSYVETIAGNLNGGREAVHTALAKNPGSLYFRDAMGYLMILQGDWEQGAAISRAAVRDNPYVRDVTFSGLWLEAFHREDFVEAYAWSQRYTNKKLFWAHIMDLTALAGMGELEMARQSAENLLLTRPDFMTIGHRLIRHFVKFEPLARRIEQSLELSGLSIDYD